MDNLKLLSSEPIYLDTVGYIHHPTIKDILNIGLNQYYTFVYIITTKPKNVFSYEDMYDFICDHLEYMEVFKLAISFFLKEKVNYYEKADRLYKNSHLEPTILRSFAYGLDGHFINKENFINFVKIIKLINCVNSEDDTEQRYNSEKAREIADKLKKSKEKRENVSNNEVITLDDIVSSVASKHPSYNLFNIWDLTVYQLYDQYKRLNLIDQYQINVSAMVQGAEIKNLKHWSTKIENK